MNDENMIFDEVALRKESVDRNTFCWATTADCRRVALRKESVDRNVTAQLCSNSPPGSLSARRAWIEIIDPCDPAALIPRRSPQGERG